MKTQPWTRAVEVLGSQQAVADVIGQPRQWVWQYLSSDRPCPPHHVLALEAATGISRHDWRPDIYPRDEVAA